jgi:hypothetical protein
MALLRRGRQDPVDSRAAGTVAFWVRWAGLAGPADQAISSGQAESLLGELSALVNAVHPGLSWELAPGSSSRHTLVVTAAGDPQLRATARRWLRAAPAADSVWSYADTRPRAANPTGVTLTIDGTEIALAAVRVLLTVGPDAVNVVMYHPAFPDLPDRATVRVAFLVLDTVLGERDVECWIGEVQTTPAPHPDAVRLTDLVTAVDQLRAKVTGPNGERGWVLLRARDPNGDVIVAGAARPLRPMSAPHLDTHVRVDVPYPSQGDGLPGQSVLTDLQALGRHIRTTIDGSGELLGEETTRGIRTLHLYTDSTTPTVEQIRACVSGWSYGAVGVHARPDATWKAIAHLR